jgi:hypothetical protein
LWAKKEATPDHQAGVLEGKTLEALVEGQVLIWGMVDLR